MDWSIGMDRSTLFLAVIGDGGGGGDDGKLVLMLVRQK